MRGRHQSSEVRVQASKRESKALPVAGRPGRETVCGGRPRLPLNAHRAWTRWSALAQRRIARRRQDQRSVHCCPTTKPKSGAEPPAARSGGGEHRHRERPRSRGFSKNLGGSFSTATATCTAAGTGRQLVEATATAGSCFANLTLGDAVAEAYVHGQTFGQTRMTVIQPLLQMIVNSPAGLAYPAFRLPDRSASACGCATTARASPAQGWLRPRVAPSAPGAPAPASRPGA